MRGGSLVKKYGPDVQLAMEYNHLGSLQKVFAVLPSGTKLCIKSVAYTAFGIRIGDSNPALHFPLGFAGGLFDPYTGFVRFGVRDYDPALGRFTCPDPSRFFGRDNDLYDYCEDDPINYVDRTGLVPLFLLPLLGTLAGPAMGVAIPYGIARLTDYLQGKRTGNSSNAAGNAMDTILPMLTDTLGVGKLGGAVTGGAALAAPALGAGVQNMLYALLSKPEVIPAILDAAMGFGDKSLPPPNNLAGGVGAVLRSLIDKASEMSVLSEVPHAACKLGEQPRDVLGRYAPCEHSSK